MTGPDDVSEELVRRTLAAMGEDPNRSGLKDTPARVVRSWATLFQGYQQDPEKILERKFQNGDYDQMILLRDIELFSTCEHHLLPFYGRAHVAYIPKGGHVVGLSKLARVVECFARRLQIQERLTEQIADSIMEFVEAQGVGVMIEAKHLCMVARGVNKQNGNMITTALRGVFKEPKVKEEFLGYLGGRK